MLQKENDDYKFIVQSITNKNALNYPKILHVFKINPVDKNEVSKVKDRCLYLRGIKSNEVNNVLTYGYPEKQNNSINESSNDLDNVRFAPLIFRNEIEEGVSYYGVDNVVKKLSFVLVISSAEKYEDYCTKNNEIIKDSRGSCVEVGLFSDESCDCETNLFGSIPAYLIVFELE